MTETKFTYFTPSPADGPAFPTVHVEAGRTFGDNLVDEHGILMAVVVAEDCPGQYTPLQLAHLFAASRDLLQACKVAQLWLRDNATRIEFSCLTRELLSVAHQVNLAIAKAERGESW